VIAVVNYFFSAISKQRDKKTTDLRAFVILSDQAPNFFIGGAIGLYIILQQVFRQVFFSLNDDGMAERHSGSVSFPPHTCATRTRAFNTTGPMHPAVGQWQSKD